MQLTAIFVHSKFHRRGAMTERLTFACGNCRVNSMHIFISCDELLNHVNIIVDVKELNVWSDGELTTRKSQVDRLQDAFTPPVPRQEVKLGARRTNEEILRDAFYNTRPNYTPRLKPTYYTDNQG